MGTVPFKLKTIVIESIFTLSNFFDTSPKREIISALFGDSLPSIDSFRGAKLVYFSPV